MSVLRKRPTREVENENEDDDEESLEQHICPTCRADLGGSSFSSCCFSSRLPHSSAHSKMCFTSFSFSVDDIFKAEAQVIKPAHFRKARPRVNQLPLFSPVSRTPFLPQRLHRPLPSESSYPRRRCFGCMSSWKNGFSRIQMQR